MLKCFVVNHQAQNRHTDDHHVLQAIADESGIRFDPGFAGRSYLEVPSDPETKGFVEARLLGNELHFQEMPRIAY
jgi:hypothetical protein